MKIVFFLIIFLNVWLNGFSQGYHPLIEAGKFWDCYDNDGSTICLRISGKRYFVNGDTLIHVMKYTFISSCPIYSTYTGVYCPPYFINPAELNQHGGALLREDSITKRVYVRGSSSDKLLYDFSLQIGDSIQFIDWNCPGVITNIVKTAILPGDSIKQFAVTSPVSTTYFTESIGSSLGLFGGFCEAIGYWGELGCVGFNPAVSTPGCAGILGIKNLNTEDYLDFHGVEGSNLINIQNNRALPADVFVLDVLGRTEAIQHIGANETASLKFHSDAVVHVLKVVYADGKVVTRKT